MSPQDSLLRSATELAMIARALLAIVGTWIFESQATLPSRYLERTKTNILFFIVTSHHDEPFCASFLGYGTSTILSTVTTKKTTTTVLPALTATVTVTTGTKLVLFFLPYHCHSVSNTDFQLRYNHKGDYQHHFGYINGPTTTNCYPNRYSNYYIDLDFRSSKTTTNSCRCQARLAWWTKQAWLPERCSQFQNILSMQLPSCSNS